MATAPSTWSPSSWRERTALHQPVWPDQAEADGCASGSPAMPPLVFAGEARQLRRVAGRGRRRGAASCCRPATAPSRSRDFSAVTHPREAEDHAADGGGADLRLDAAGGQGRPHRRPVRQAALQPDRDGGRRRAADASAGTCCTATSPRPRRATFDPERMLQGYHQSAATLNLLRAFTKGGFADLTKVHLWNQEFVASRRRAGATSDRHRDRAGAALHGGLRHRPRARAPAARGGRVDEPRGPPARLRAER